MATPPIEVHARRGQPFGMPPARFLRDYWQKHPLLIRGAFPTFNPPLAPDDLAGLACLEGALARIITHRGERHRSATGAHHNEGTWQVRTGPFDDATFAQLPTSDWTLLVQDADKWDADTRALLAHFACIPSWRIDDVMISYAADGGGVGAHVDQYDVFLLQGLGQRRWSIDTRPHPPTTFRANVELKLLAAFAPNHTWLLEPGDMLYLPPGVPHDGVAVGECTTYSIGMRAPATGELLFDLAAHLAEVLPESQRLTDPDLAPATATGEIDAAAIARVRATLGPVVGALSADAFGDWFGSFITRYRTAQVATPRKRAVTPDAVATRLAQTRFQRDPWTRIAWRRTGRAAHLYVAGRVWAVPLAWARVLASKTDLDGATLQRLPAQARGCELLAELINAGHLGMRRR